MIADVTTANVEAGIADFVASCYDDPLGFVRGAYPWQEPGGPLAEEAGPDANQIEFLTALGAEIQARRFNGTDPVMPILMNETSGHGTGKSAMGGWLADFILSTRPHSIGTVTAGPDAASARAIAPQPPTRFTPNILADGTRPTGRCSAGEPPPTPPSRPARSSAGGGCAR